LFDVTDEDKDGYINEEEFLNCVSKYCKSDNETICEEIFKISDTNKDDYIDKKEFFMIVIII
jgi:Ca2+-binding EF-hand superfamily protein